jgi:ankyrin repeat protein
VTEPQDPRTAFIEQSVGHGSLEGAEAILAAHPEVATSDIHTAAILGDEASVSRFLTLDPRSATAKAGPLGWDALTHLCFSRYLRLDKARGDAFVRAAVALLDAGASASTGYFDDQHEPGPEFESALYGAAGLAHHAGLTRLLLERGADPNDGETVYHAPETHDNTTLDALLASGRLDQDSLAAMLLRKADWHDPAGVQLLLEHGADPNRITPWGFTALHQAVRRDNALETVERLLDHGADPGLLARNPRKPHSDGRSAAELAARRGRGDILDLLESRGIRFALPGAAELVAACARNQGALMRALAASRPELVASVVREGGRLLGDFAGVGNTAGVRLLLELGVDVQAPYAEDDGYWQVGAGSTALHVAAWRARHATVRLLVEHGASVNVPDDSGRTPLARAVRACVDSYWTESRSPESVRTLLAAGADAAGVAYPSGYPEVDELLKRARP